MISTEGLVPGLPAAVVTRRKALLGRDGCRTPDGAVGGGAATLKETLDEKAADDEGFGTFPGRR